MSDILNEQLSALLDGELPPEETTLLLKRIAREAELTSRLRRYRMCGDVLRGERVQARADFAMRVSAAIAAEPPLPAPRHAARRSLHIARWVRPLAGLAVAASVATVAVLVLRQGPVATSVPAQVAAIRTAAPAPVARVLPSYPQDSSEPPIYVTPAATRAPLGTIPEAMLANYVVAHSQASAPFAGQSVLIHLVADGTGAPAPAR
ncbi:MAG TPA: sigma-E factor negative regulatory protein [Steroidobacteraceae bacterium]|nr:sigma-E factor negative regulatory protein [Steroidobacteraceae bacterium]